MENYEEYAEKRDAFNKAKDEFRKAESNIITEVLEKAKYKIGDTVVIIQETGWGNNVGKKGIVSSIHAPTFTHNGQAESEDECFATYKLNKINKDGSMHKTAGVDYYKFGESDIELV